MVGTPLKVGTILLAALLVNRLARRTIRRTVDRLGEVDASALLSESTSLRTQQRAESIGTLLKSGTTVLVFSITLVLVLDTLGISVVPLLASLGIAGVAIGFGAQSVIEDLISGILLVVEDQFGIGDRVDVGVVEGVVERVTLRSTLILSPDGVRWYVPNSQIERVANESQHLARARVQIGVAYSADLPKAVATIQAATAALAAQDRWQEAGATEPSIPVVAELAKNSIVLETQLFLKPVERRAFEQALRPQLVEAANNADVELPNTQVDVWLRSVDGVTPA